MGTPEGIRNPEIKYTQVCSSMVETLQKSIFATSIFRIIRQKGVRWNVQGVQRNGTVTVSDRYMEVTVKIWSSINGVIVGAHPEFWQGVATSEDAGVARIKPAWLPETFGVLMLKFAFSHTQETLFFLFLTFAEKKIDKNGILKTLISLKYHTFNSGVSKLLVEGANRVCKIDQF